MVIDSNKYENIIFDLGAVIINIDHSLTAKSFVELGLNINDPKFKNAQQILFDSFEKGEMASQEFRKKIKSYFKNPPEDKEIDLAWNAMLLDLPIERLDLLKKLKTKHRTFLLSNTNEIHFNAISNYLQNKFEIHDLSVFFEKTYLSYKVGMRKPDREIFDLVVSDNNLDPKKTLFIDDSEENIEAAQNLGIQVYCLDVKKESMLDLF
ncbi:MAG: hypothetical protein A3F72_08815 [Bacteroidetes bacterium RIFCSPLOWO2_12_FULL_35_15]|nr:MAG: hypothetical protein A3F72_08815 [Bacteroidetes bacterium RIFCSPLOWO2_12_FULL_35_15]